MCHPFQMRTIRTPLTEGPIVEDRRFMERTCKNHRLLRGNIEHPDRNGIFEVGGFNARLHSDPKIGGYWKGQNTQTKRRGRQLVWDFLVEAFGGPAFYNGLDIETTHQGLGISENDWEVMEKHAVAGVDKFEAQSKPLGRPPGSKDSRKKSRRGYLLRYAK